MSNQTINDPYRSRTDSQWEAVAREDPVVWNGGDGTLSVDLVQSYERDGLLRVPDLLSTSEARELLAEANGLAGNVDRPQPGVVFEPEGGVVRSLFRMHRTNDKFKTVAKDPRLADVARQLLGSDVYVHQSRINFKQPVDGKEFFWHSDFETWHVEDGMPRMRAVSVSISLTENNEFNGPLLVVPGSHWTYIRCAGATPEDHFEQSLVKQEYGVPSRDALRQLVDRGGMMAAKGPAGSALFFECNLMHGSVGNLSPYQRTNLFVVYNSVDNALAEPFGTMPPRPAFLGEREVVPVDDL